MRKRCLTLSVAAIVVGLSGPVAAVRQDKIPYIPRVQPAAEKSTTVTGCVARGTAAETYVLTNVTREGEAPVKPAAKPESLLLSGADVDMSKHVGHQVSVTGVAAATDHAIGTTGATAVKPAAESTMKTDAKVPARFTVQSLKMISATCSEVGD
jgi:hypothetical protein